MNTRSSDSNLVEPLEDPEKLFQKQHQSSLEFKSETSESSIPTSESESESKPSTMAEEENRDEQNMSEYNKCTLEDIQTNTPWGVLQDPKFELSASQIRLITDLVKFHGLPHESANLHLSKFLQVSQNLKAEDVKQDEIRLRLFPYTLAGNAENWLASLPAGSITSWAELIKAFLDEYFPPDLTARYRAEITGFKQHPSESLFEAWTRYKTLLRKCPHHGIPLWQIVQNFYNALDGKSRFTMDMSSNGSFTNQNAKDGWSTIEKMARNSQYWDGGRNDVQLSQPTAAAPIKSVPQRQVHQVNEINSLQAKMDSLAHQVAQMTQQRSNSFPSLHFPSSSSSSFTQDINQVSSQLGCEICQGDHFTAECQIEQVDYVGNNPYSNNYNPGWRNHPNFRWRDEDQQKQQPFNQPYQPYQNNQFQNQQFPRQFQRQGNPITGTSFPAKQFPAIQSGPIRPSLEAPPANNQSSSQKKTVEDSLEKRFMENEKRMRENEAATRNMQATLQNLESTIGQLAKLLTDRQPGTLPANNEPNPK